MKGLLLLLILATFVTDSHQNPDEKRLIYDIFAKSDYNRLVRPARNASDTVEVNFGISLQQIVDMDETKETAKYNIWLNYEWKDYQLAWDPSEYGGVQSIRLPSDMIWTPDLLMYNTASEEIDNTYPTRIVLYSDGTCSWVPLGLFTSSCSFDMAWFPVDEQICTMKFGSWTYDGTKLDLQAKSDEVDISTYQASVEWELLDTSAKRTAVYYDCCPEPYVDITFTLHVQRRPLYYSVTIVLPIALISLLNLFIFLLPPDSGERISLGVTVLLCLTVLSTVVSNSVPPTSMSVPLINVYLACMMFLCTLSVIMSVIVLNLHYRNHNVPSVLQKLYGVLGRLVCLSREQGASMDRETKAEGGQEDWRFAARVMDRLCLLVFFLYFVITTLVIFV